jgi:hypothetical protein
MTKYLRRRGLLDDGDDAAEEADASERAGLTRLAASAVSGAVPPAGPEWRRGALPLTPRAMVFERPLCVALDGFTLHAATRAGGLDEQGREALLKYILRPAVAQERVTRGPDGLVRIALKKALSDGTVAVDLDALSLLSRLCASVPPPRFHTVRYAGVLGSASKLRSRLAPKRAATASARCVEDVVDLPRRRSYRPWAELLRRTFGFDVLACPRCDGRLRLLAMVTEPKSVARYLRALGEPTDAPARAPARGPPFWKSRVLRRAASDHAAEQRAPARAWLPWCVLDRRGRRRQPPCRLGVRPNEPVRPPAPCAQRRPPQAVRSTASRPPPPKTRFFFLRSVRSADGARRR